MRMGEVEDIQCEIEWCPGLDSPLRSFASSSLPAWASPHSLNHASCMICCDAISDRTTAAHSLIVQSRAGKTSSQTGIGSKLSVSLHHSVDCLQA